MIIVVFVAGCHSCSLFFFFFNDTATTEIYTLSLHDALPICLGIFSLSGGIQNAYIRRCFLQNKQGCHDIYFGNEDRKSTRLNSSHLVISYAVFCLKKKKESAKNLHTQRMSTERSHNIARCHT